MNVALEGQSGPCMIALISLTDWFSPVHAVRGACSSALAMTHETPARFPEDASVGNWDSGTTFAQRDGSFRIGLRASAALCKFAWAAVSEYTRHDTPISDRRLGNPS